MFAQDSERGVSPVIGVILMVAVTVALVALVTVVVFDIGDDVSDPADITINTDLEGEGGEAELTVEVVRNENVDELRAEGASLDDAVISGEGEVGTEFYETATSGGGDDDELQEDPSGETVELIALVGDNEEIVQTIEIE